MSKFLKGSNGNPGGLTREAAAARSQIRQALMMPGLMAKALACYERLLEQDNPLIAKDYMDRVGGKPKEHIELSEDPDAPVNHRIALTLEELQAIARSQLEKEKSK